MTQVAPPITGVPRMTRGSLLPRVLRRLSIQFGLLLLSIVIVLVVWQGFLDLFHLDPYFAKRPKDIIEAFVSNPDSGEKRALVKAALAVTVLDAGIGFLAGTALAMAVAIGFVIYPVVEQTLMPFAIALRTIPLVALTPLIVLIFGRGVMATIVISGIITFFPSLVYLVLGLRSISSESIDLFLSFGATKWTILRKARFPSALPSLFAAARIAAPGALLGALVAEWLATGKGLGYLMVTAPHTSSYAILWGAGIVVVILSALLYAVVAVVETLVLARYAPEHIAGRL